MKKVLIVVLLFVIIGEGVVFSFPRISAWHSQQKNQQTFSTMFEQFPVTVDPKNKVIVENIDVNTFLNDANSPFQASALNAVGAFWGVVDWLASSLTSEGWYQKIAGVAGTTARIVVITPGMRKEQVARAFAKALSWNTTQTKQFTITTKSSPLPLPEGSFSPGTYLVNANMTPQDVQTLVNNRFTEEILAHYGTTTAEKVPLDQALTIASMIQREAGGTSDMRIISGIIWNRLFINMRLQIDATVQYAKANSSTVTSWWPKVTPADLSRKSPYNTYQNMGLPPTPISNPSVATVLAALNPVKTSCMYYFHDNAGQFHCSNTYVEHVALLKQYFGRGK